jgi:hypothetical protein
MMMMMMMMMMTLHSPIAALLVELLYKYQLQRCHMSTTAN